MRWLIFACVLVALFTTFAVVSFVDFPEPEDEQVQQFPNHRPETSDERAAARVVLAYMRAVIENRPADACRLVGRPLEYTLRCSTHPRIPDDMQTSATEGLRIANISLHSGDGEAWVSGTSPGPLQSVAFARVDGSWRVFRHDGAFGLA